MQVIIKFMCMPTIINTLVNHSEGTLFQVCIGTHIRLRMCQ